MNKRAVGDRIVERKRLLEMRSRRREPAAIHQVSTSGQVAQNKPGRIVTLVAQRQYILSDAQRPAEFATV